MEAPSAAERVSSVNTAPERFTFFSASVRKVGSAVALAVTVTVSVRSVYPVAVTVKLCSPVGTNGMLKRPSASVS